MTSCNFSFFILMKKKNDIMCDFDFLMNPLAKFSSINFLGSAYSAGLRL